MPTYVYRCLECEKQFEVQQSFSDDALTSCNCEKAAPVKKVFTPVGVTFKGSGFYKTDSRSSGSKSSSTSTTSTDPAPSSSPSSDSGSSSTGGSSASGSSGGTSGNNSTSGSGSSGGSSGSSGSAGSDKVAS